MNTLGALVLAALATAIAFPSGPTGPPIISQLPYGKAHQPRPFLRDYVLPRMLLSNPTYRFEDSPRIMPAPQPRDNYWLNKEIERLNQMQAEEVGMSRFEREFPRWMARDPYFTRPYIPLRPRGNPNNVPDFMTSISKEEPLLPYIPAMKKDMTHPEPRVMEHKVNKESFAMTPLDTGYYEPEPTIMKPETDDHHEGNILTKTIIYERPRQTRQNPIGRTKNLVTGDLEKLRIGFTNQPDSTDKPNFHQPVEATESFFGVALMAAMGGVFTIAIFGFAFAWYTLNKKAKAAADIDYPAYGVTGPNIDSSGDRKLAHSAHMYHYQHQKQQIIAMERNGMEQRNGSVSDPESEEENEEGDYTVYECPGFATTGEMEVKNPLFSEDPTPATPGKCELVKPQPKE